MGRFLITLGKAYQVLHVVDYNVWICLFWSVPLHFDDWYWFFTIFTACMYILSPSLMRHYFYIPPHSFFILIILMPHELFDVLHLKKITFYFRAIYICGVKSDDRLIRIIFLSLTSCFEYVFLFSIQYLLNVTFKISCCILTNQLY